MLQDLDWTEGERILLDLGSLPQEAQRLVELQFSPDGERVGHILGFSEGECRIGSNGDLQEEEFDNAWMLRFTPDSRLTALVSSLGAWSMRVEDVTWPEEYDYIWNPLFSESGEVISAAVQKEGFYGMVRDQATWGELFPYATDYAMSADGSMCCCVVQTAPLSEGDINAFRAKVFSVAVNGRVWPWHFQNVWTPVPDSSTGRTAAVVRRDYQDCSVAVDGLAWPQRFDNAWEPLIAPGGEVFAPVQLGSKWGLARDGEMVWPARYCQLWHLQTDPRGQRIAAIVSPQFGRFTVRYGERIWKTSYPVLTDLRLGPEGERVAAVGASRIDPEQPDSLFTPPSWQLVVDDQPASGWFEQVFPPVFSPDGGHVAARIKHNKRFGYILDGKAYPREFDRAWDPVFSPDGGRILLRVREGDSLKRIVASTDEFK
ncbi:MAG: WD40 repeat domain-containing protein [Desulfohalobiaceae bacterium]|nr:WD40 repeat domain-containing protein [Desulfohalobiaceae bacterium]